MIERERGRHTSERDVAACMMYDIHTYIDREINIDTPVEEVLLPASILQAKDVLQSSKARYTKSPSSSLA